MLCAIQKAVVVSKWLETDDLETSGPAHLTDLFGGSHLGCVAARDRADSGASAGDDDEDDNGCLAESARGSVNQDCLALLDASQVVERVNRGCVHEREAGRLFKRH